MNFQASKMKRLGHTSWLVITLYSILLISIDNSSASNHELKEELRFIHQEIGLLRDENHHQNMEIALLKEKIGITKDSNDQRMIAASLNNNHRNKRQVRFLPPNNFYWDPEKETEQQKQINGRRYEPPTNCYDLFLIGYTLNGFYLVKSNESVKSTKGDIKLETVFCAFQQPEGTFNPSRVEKRIIPRSETKPPSCKVLYFNGTRKTDLEAIGTTAFTITFDEVHLNLGNAFDETTGIFSVPKSGEYLFIFRGMVTLSPNANNEFIMYYHKNGKDMETDYVSSQSNKPKIVRLDRQVKLERGDKIRVGAWFWEKGLNVAKFSHDSTSFVVNLLDEE